MWRHEPSGAWFGGILLLAAPAIAAVPQGYNLIWSDEFNGPSLDGGKWRINEPGWWGDAYNSIDSVSVAGGALKITTFTRWDVDGGNDPGEWEHRAAVLGTQDTQLFKYGYFEARISFNTSPGAYSAFWLMSPTIDENIGHPELAGTEMDIVEHRAVNGDGEDRTSHVYTAVHWDGYGSHHQSAGALHGPFAGVDNGTWNTYALLWTPTGYTFYLDGTEIWRRDTEISRAEQYIVLSTLVDDHSWAGDIPAGGYGPLETSTTSMEVDYVRVYHAPEPSAPAVAALAAIAACRARGVRRLRGPLGGRGRHGTSADAD
jgi:beta-glucanase (GH16 family)